MRGAALTAAAVGTLLPGASAQTFEIGSDIVLQADSTIKFNSGSTLKYAGELMLKSYNQVFDLPYTIIRPSALYGERCVSRRVTQIFITK